MIKFLIVFPQTSTREYTNIKYSLSETMSPFADPSMLPPLPSSAGLPPASPSFNSSAPTSPTATSVSTGGLGTLGSNLPRPPDEMPRQLYQNLAQEMKGGGPQQQANSLNLNIGPPPACPPPAPPKKH